MYMTFEQSLGLLPEVGMGPRQTTKRRSGFKEWFHGPGQIVLTLIGATFLLMSTVVGAALWANNKMNHFEASVAEANKASLEVRAEQAKYVELLTTVLDGEKRRNDMASEDRKALVEAFRYLALRIADSDRRQRFLQLVKELEEKKISQLNDGVIAPTGVPR